MEISVLTYNINGFRAAIRKGLLDWLRTNPADVVCFQEVKAIAGDFDLKPFEDLGYHPYFFYAQKKGYSGVGILTKIRPERVIYGNGYEQSDYEGRVIRADFKELSVVSAYFPSGTSGALRQQYKYQWLDEFAAYLNELRKEQPRIAVCGDYNIAHKEIDIHNPKSNKKSSGFLPEERAWMDRLFASGFYDGFRLLNQEPAQYTWWHQLRKSNREQNKGWRIDYISVTDSLKGRVSHATILPEVKHSDHCPVKVVFDFG